MSDVDLRELERRWRASGAAEDEARWHLARVRAGRLAPERLALAAWAGWPAAALAAQEAATTATAEAAAWVRRLFGREPLAPAAALGPDWAGLGRWLGRGLRDAPPEAGRRVALAEVERVVGALAALEADAPRLGPAVTAWARAARAVLRDAADAAAEAIVGEAAVEPPARLEWLDEPPRAPAPALDALRGAWPAAVRAVAAACRGGRGDAWWTAYDGRAGKRAGAGPVAAGWPDAARAAARDALAPWALGLGDPLRARAAGALDALEVASPCPASWDAMRPVDEAGRVRACERCARQVHDLSALTRAEAEALLAATAGGRLCVRLYRRADGRVLTRDCPDGVDALVDQGAPRHQLLGRIAPPASARE